MVFSSPIFLYIFLPLTILMYLIAATITPSGRQRLPNLVLLAASLVFYAWGGGTYFYLLLLVISINYVAGFFVAPEFTRRHPRSKRWALFAAVAFNLVVLGYFKYANFFVGEIQGVRSQFALEPVAWIEVALPIGISFFIFQTISYVVDVSRGDAVRSSGISTFALYISMFPQLIAGPIVRYRTVADALKERSHTLSDIAAGSARFAHGLFKKIVIADSVAPIADMAFASPDPTMVDAWIGLLAYTLQIYFDFSGYSDMAIGLGRIFGFRFPENFNRPYSAESVTDFWRRWHMTLSNYFKDYMYIPLEGNRHGAFKTHRNLIGVFLLTGVWHGAAWTFIIWGLWHGLILIVERSTGYRSLTAGTNQVFRRILTILLVMIGWVLFRAQDLSSAADYLAAMISEPSGVSVEMLLLLNHATVLVLVAGVLVFLLPADWTTGVRLAEVVTDRSSKEATSRRELNVVIAAGYTCIALLVCFTLAFSTTYSPFLYFQF